MVVSRGQMGLGVVGDAWLGLSGWGRAVARFFRFQRVLWVYGVSPPASTSIPEAPRPSLIRRPVLPFSGNSILTFKLLCDFCGGAKMCPPACYFA